MQKKPHEKTVIYPVSQDQKSVLRQMMELYQYDFSEFDRGDLNDNGYYLAYRSKSP